MEINSTLSHSKASTKMEDRTLFCFGGISTNQLISRSKQQVYFVCSDKKTRWKKGRRAEEIPNILWSYRMTYIEVMGMTHFRMIYEVEAIIPLEVKMSLLRLEHFDEEKNDKGLHLSIDTIDEFHDIALS